MPLCIILCGICKCLSRRFMYIQVGLYFHTWLCFFNDVYFSDTVHLSAVIQSATVKQETGVRFAAVGDNVTLRCFYESQVAMHFSWYRQFLGSQPKRLSTFYKYDKPSEVLHTLEKNPRFSVERKEGTNHLQISGVRLSDSATYYCGSSHSNMVEFGEGIFLSVRGILLLFFMNTFYSMFL